MWRSNDKTRVITVQRRLRGEASRLAELNRLAEAAGYTVVSSMEQVRSSDSSYQIGKGKVHELADLVEDLNVEKIVFNNDIKPIQAYNIAKITGAEVIDRFQLILEIFVKPASTRETQLQVKLASLRHNLPRVRESVRLARMGEQPGFLGLGRYEIDVHIEAIKRQIAHIRKELRSVRNKRGLHRVRRIEYGFSLVSLAGYTYAGKTTLFNKLAAESKDVDQGLFTTLSTTTRAVDFNDRKVLLTDTVGFIDQLPLALIEAFRSTLEETVLADAIILVIDFHEPVQEIGRKLICCLDTLHEIGVYGTPIVTALNKIDRMAEEEIRKKLDSLGELVKNPVLISALNETNLEEMKRKVIELLDEHLQASFVLPPNSESLSFISSLYDHVSVINASYEEEEIRISLKAMPWLVNKILGQIEKLGGRLLEAAYLPKTK